MRRSDRRLAALLFFTYAWFFQSGQHNEAARLDLTRALVEDGTTHIDRFISNSADVIQFGDGRFYSNKAPGASLVAVPIWAAGSALLARTSIPEGLRWHLLCWFVTALTVGVAGAVAGALQFRLLRRYGFGDGVALFVALALGLGTIAFPFSTLFFSHQLAATMLFGCFYAVFAHHQDREVSGAVGRLGVARLLFGGLAGGFAFTTEYPAAFALVGIGVYALARLGRDRQWRALTILAIGVAGGTAPLFVYNVVAFGQIWYTPLEAYAAAGSTSYVAHQQGLLGLRNPFTNAEFWRAIAAITVGRQRGILYCNPVLWLALPGFVLGLARRTARARAHRIELGLGLGLTLFFVALNASYGTSIYYWGGGNSIGARYLLIVLPFVGLPLAVALATRGGRIIGYPLVAISIASMLAMTAVEPRAPLDYADPVRQLGLPNFLRGDLAICTDGIFSSQLVTADSVAFNVGKLIGLPARWQLMPLYVVWGLGILLLRRSPGAGSRGAAAAGTALLVVLAFTPPIHGWLHAQVGATGGGLLGRYYPTDDLTGEPRWQQIDPVVHFDWSSDGRPFPGPFSVAWEGTIQIDRGGPHTFVTESDDASWVYIGGELVVDNSGPHGLRRVDGLCLLEPGLHTIRVAFADYGFGALMRLTWRPPGAAIEVPIPAGLLSAELAAD